MECQACHKANPDSCRYCEHCGAPLSHRCPACGFDCGPAARFCGGCGKPLPKGHSQDNAGAIAPLAATQASAWGELKQATVLFADIVSSTEQIARLDPEEAMDRLQPAVTLMCEAVERFGGTVIRTLGDGVMALFGVPNTLEGHTRLACEAALHMQQAMARKPGGLSIRVGLHCGLVASDPQAHDTGKGGGAHGLTIHLASRVVGVAPPGGVTMTQHCHALVQAFVEVDSLGHPPLKGIAEPVEIFRLRALKPAFASQYFQQAKLTPFRGREKEMALLQQAQRLTEVADAQVIGVCGGPGAGKSRLCYEFTQWCRARGKPVFEVRAQLYGSATPLQPVLELMRTFFFGITAGDDAGAGREKIAARLAELESAQTGDHELLCEFLGVADGESELVAAVAPKARRARLLAIVSELMKHSAGTVAVILIEDMHWLDEASEEFVAALVDAISATRTMVLLNYRSSYRSPWTGRENFREIEVGELSPTDTEAIVRELISHRREFQDISQLIVRRSGGNPFFAEELVRSLAERGVLSGEPDHSCNGVESVERALPATVQAVIGARIDRLHESEKSLLQMCAIIGKEIPLGILARVAGVPRQQLERLLDALCQAELIQPQPAAQGRRFTFRHPLIQEVAYGSQMKAKRAGVHLAAAAAMQEHYAGQNEHAALIAYHFEAARHYLEAARYLARAAIWVAANDSARAVDSWRRVRSLLEAADKGPEVDSLKVLACAKLAWLGWREGLPKSEVMQFIHEARQIAGRDDDRILRLLLFLEGRMEQASGGSVDRYVDLVKQAMTTLEPDAPAGSKVLMNTALCQAYTWAGMFDKALEASDAALAGAGEVDKFEEDFIGYSLHQWSLVLRGRTLVRVGRLEEAAQALSAVTGLPAQMVDPVLLEIAHYGMTEVACANEDLERAKRHAHAVSLIAEKHANPYVSCFAHACRALLDQARGEFAAAISGFSQALELVRSHNVAREFETELLACLAECCYSTKDLRQAQKFAEEGIVLSNERGNRQQQVRALVIASAVLRVVGGEAGHRRAEELLMRANQLVRASESSALSFRVKAVPEIALG